MTPEKARAELREFHDRYFAETGSALTLGMARTVDALLDEMREALLVALGGKRWTPPPPPGTLSIQIDGTDPVWVVPDA